MIDQRIKYTNANHRLRRTDSGGFTLLEVILAVALSVFVMAAISSAIYQIGTVVKRQQESIERSQIARNVLMTISNDLRSAFQHKPADVTGLQALSLSQEAIAGLAGGLDPAALGDLDTSGIDPSSIDPSELGGAGGAGGAGGTGADPGAAADETGSNTQAGFLGNPPVLVPGLYGNQNELMLDISRLPRIDQYDPIVLGTDQAVVTLPSDLKTISYFVSGESLESEKLATGTDLSVNGGLYRRELDRAVAAFNMDAAGALAKLGGTKLIANEVTGINFRYFNGTDWQTEWDSEQESGFPTAIEITVIVDNQRLISEDVRYTLQPNAQNGESYRLVVNLPAAEILSQEELDMIQAAGGAQ